MVQLPVNAEYIQCQNGNGSKDECCGSSEKRNNYTDLRDHGTLMTEGSLARRGYSERRTGVCVCFLMAGKLRQGTWGGT